jgi:hypothetical protein
MEGLHRMALFDDRRVIKLVQEGFAKGKSFNYQGVSINFTLEHIDPYRSDLGGYRWRIDVFGSSFTLPLGANISAPGGRVSWIFKYLERFNPNYKGNHSIAIFIHNTSLDIIDKIKR